MKKIVFMGTPEFSVRSLQALIDHPDYEVSAVVTQPDRPVGRKHRLQASAVKKRPKRLIFPSTNLKKSVKTKTSTSCSARGISI